MDRVKKTKVRSRNVGHASIKLDLDFGKVVIYKQAIDRMGLVPGKSHVMFGLDRKNGKAYIYEEEPEEDNYRLRQYRSDTPVIFNKELVRSIIAFFDEEDSNIVYLDVSKTKDDKGRHELTFGCNK